MVKQSLVRPEKEKEREKEKEKPERGRRRRGKCAHCHGEQGRHLIVMNGLHYS